MLSRQETLTVQLAKYISCPYAMQHGNLAVRGLLQYISSNVQLFDIWYLVCITSPLGSTLDNAAAV